jgi:catechol 2,3-dioxygenase-like lactoylglutathione lyase family enzyme
VLIDCKTSNVDEAARFWGEALGRSVDKDHPNSRAESEAWARASDAAAKDATEAAYDREEMLEARGEWMERRSRYVGGLDADNVVAFKSPDAWFASRSRRRPATLPLGSVAYEGEPNQHGERTVWLDEIWVNGLGAMRGPTESYSDVILRIARAGAGAR